MTSATDNRTTKLLPCPFCGGNASIQQNNDSGEWHVSTIDCGIDSPYHHAYVIADTEAEAIAAWNTRADTEYGAIPATDENMAKYGWVRERTCEWLLEHSGTLYDKWRCSECGYLYVDSRTDGGVTDLDPNFCPNCGAKVVSA